jgi:hypothetical protein
LGHSKVIAAICALALLSGCASIRWTLQKSMRHEGLVNEAFPEIVWEAYACDEQELPFFEIETNELIPPRVKPGGEFNHRIIYSLCPARPTEVVSGRLETQILYKGKPIYRETSDDYEFLPGRWRVDTFVEIPPTAAPGVYSYRMEFTSESTRFERGLTFLVPIP